MEVINLLEENSQLQCLTTLKIVESSNLKNLKMRFKKVKTSWMLLLEGEKELITILLVLAVLLVLLVLLV